MTNGEVQVINGQVRVSRHGEGESGLSLIELIIAIFILAVSLSALAAGLMASLRATAESERRVRATAVGTQVQETMQALPWEEAALYEDEVSALVPYGVDTSTTPPTFEGEELVVQPGPPASGRDPEVPEPTESRTESGQAFEIARLITWRDTNGDGVDDTKRFVTILEWEDLTKSRVERFESFRTATAEEAGDPTKPRVLQFDVGPDPMDLVDDSGDVEDVDEHTGTIRVVVRFSEGVNPARLSFYRLPASATASPQTLTLETVSMTPVIADPAKPGHSVQWETTIPARSYRFPKGPRPFYVEGTLSSGPDITGTTSMTFVGDASNAAPMADPGSGAASPPDDSGDGGEPSTVTVPVSIDTIIPSSTTICVKNSDLKTAWSLRVNVTGMTPADWQVTATYSPRQGASRTDSLLPEGGNAAITPAGSWFRLDFAEGTNPAGFAPTGNGNGATHTTVFTINASRTADGSGADADGPENSGQITIRRHNSC